jgi:hypothetical protein
MRHSEPALLPQSIFWDESDELTAEIHAKVALLPRALDIICIYPLTVF